MPTGFRIDNGLHHTGPDPGRTTGACAAWPRMTSVQVTPVTGEVREAGRAACHGRRAARRVTGRSRNVWMASSRKQHFDYFSRTDGQAHGCTFGPGAPH